MQYARLGDPNGPGPHREFFRDFSRRPSLDRDSPKRLPCLLVKMRADQSKGRLIEYVALARMDDTARVLVHGISGVRHRKIAEPPLRIGAAGGLNLSTLPTVIVADVEPR